MSETEIKTHKQAAFERMYAAAEERRNVDIMMNKALDQLNKRILNKKGAVHPEIYDKLKKGHKPFKYRETKLPVKKEEKDE